MNQSTKNMIEEFSPMWTNKQTWEYEQANEDLGFDMACSKPGEMSWDSKFASRDSDLRDMATDMYEPMTDGYELWIAEKDRQEVKKQHIPYIMAVMVDVMSDEEACLNFRTDGGYIVASIDTKADVIDCKEFFEKFYHLATGFNYAEQSGIPKDETEAEIYILRLQDEFDSRMKAGLGDKYLPGNADPDTEGL
ncbi:MAG: hypothetical protein D9C04_00170 [Nitrosopumilus sp. B06]|nr:MAG: hypothetical protein EB828_01465 [Nitrosopumilus sp. D6]RNJ80731.1 MAG: hypothetical protein D9C04_00170 [Nitrosopumilus sp. B06]